MQEFPFSYVDALNYHVTFYPSMVNFPCPFLMPSCVVQGLLLEDMGVPLDHPMSSLRLLIVHTHKTTHC